MALYNLSEFITTVKENIGIKDLPLLTFMTGSCFMCLQEM